MPWVDNRENDILDLMKRLVSVKNTGLIKTLDRNPTGKLNENDMSAVYLFEGDDVVDTLASKASRAPQKRNMVIMVEMWVYELDVNLQNSKLRTLYNAVKQAMVTHKALFELRTTRVYTTAVVGVLGVGILFELKYVENGD